MSDAPNHSGQDPSELMSMDDGSEHQPSSQQQGMHNVNGPSQPQVSNGPMPQRVSSSQPTTNNADPEKRKLIQQQLVLLLHAYKCQRSEKSNGESAEAPCSLPHCKTMKDVLQHMTMCSEEKQCSIPHCASSRQIIAHWRNCNRGDCPVCSPLKNASERRNSQMSNNLLQNVPNQAPSNLNSMEMSGVPNRGGQASSGPMLEQSPMHTGGAQAGPQGAKKPISDPEMKKAYAALGLQYNPGGQSHQQPLAGCASQPHDAAWPGNIQLPGDTPMKEWHKNVSAELRLRLIHKLVQAIFPSPDPQVLNDPRMANLIQYAKKVEMDMYKAANSREEYYHMLAGKICKLLKELEEKRKTRLTDRNQQLPPGVSPGLPMMNSGVQPVVGWPNSVVGQQQDVDISEYFFELCGI